MTDPEIAIRYSLEMSNPDWNRGRWARVQDYPSLEDATTFVKVNRRAARYNGSGVRYRILVRVTGTAVVDDEDV